MLKIDNYYVTDMYIYLPRTAWPYTHVDISLNLWMCGLANRIFIHVTFFQTIVCNPCNTVLYRVTHFELYGEEDYLFLSYANYTQRFTMETPSAILHRLVHTGYHVVHVKLHTGHYGIDSLSNGIGFRMVYASKIYN